MLDPANADAIIPLLLRLSEGNEEVTMQLVIQELEDVICRSFNELKTFNNVKSVWTNRIINAATLSEISIGKRSCSWKKLRNRFTEWFSKQPSRPHPQPVVETASASAPASASASITSTTSTTSVSLTSASLTSATPTVSTATSTKIPATNEDKAKFLETFNSLDKSKFWVLDATRVEANEDVDVLSVEEKMRDFVLHCEYLHPAFSLILDLADSNWLDVFSPKEIQELDGCGRAILRPLDTSYNQVLQSLQCMSSSLQAYSYAQKLDYHPVEQPMLGWISLSVMSLARLFLLNTNLQKLKEADKQYNMWGFISTVFQGSHISAIGKEKSSRASQASLNRKRKLSSKEDLDRCIPGRKVDVLYVSGSVELGCAELGTHHDETKELVDGSLKMPTVLRDMLSLIATKYPSIIHEVDLIGYNIHGEELQLLTMDCPFGYVARLRHLDKLSFPSNDENFCSRIVPLLKVAITVKIILEATLGHVNNASTPLRQTSLVQPVVFPPSFIPVKKAKSTSD